jgi:chorismate dehydratase
MSIHEPFSHLTSVGKFSQCSPVKPVETDKNGLIGLIRFGQINFINVLPLTMPLLTSQDQSQLEFVLDTPSALNRSFEEGHLDVSAMSSFYFLQNGNLELVPLISIASKGAVGSVLFFADRPLVALQGCKIAITSASATSVNLLKVLFAEKIGFIPEFVVCDEPELNAEFAGALVIGDRALAFDQNWDARSGDSVGDSVRVDLGAWWFEAFSLPMVFGVWAARKQFVESNRARFQELCSDLRHYFDAGLGTQFAAVVAEASRRTGLSSQRLSVYYRQELNFDMTAEHLKGLELYRTLCFKHGLL